VVNILNAQIEKAKNIYISKYNKQINQKIIHKFKIFEEFVPKMIRVCSDTKNIGLQHEK